MAFTAVLQHVRGTIVWCKSTRTKPLEKANIAGEVARGPLQSGSPTHVGGELFVAITVPDRVAEDQQGRNAGKFAQQLTVAAPIERAKPSDGKIP